MRTAKVLVRSLLLTVSLATPGAGVFACLVESMKNSKTEVEDIREEFGVVFIEISTNVYKFLQRN